MHDFSVCIIVFDGQFWIAVITRFQGGEYFEARYTFGIEEALLALLYPYHFQGSIQ